MKNKKYSEEEIKDMAKRIRKLVKNKNKTKKEIMKELGITQTTIYNHVELREALQSKIRQIDIIRQNIDKINEMRKAGNSIFTIADTLGVKPWTIYNFIYREKNK